MITKLFNITAKALMKLAQKLHLTYNEVNIIVYYMIVPLTWAVMLDFIVGTWPWITVAWAAVCLLVIWCNRKRFSQWCEWAFKKSVDFLESFGFMGWDYYKASVIICVFIVIIIYAVLALLLIL